MDKELAVTLEVLKGVVARNRPVTPVDRDLMAVLKTLGAIRK
jgi:hypothetical protein